MPTEEELKKIKEPLVITITVSKNEEGKFLDLQTNGPVSGWKLIGIFEELKFDILKGHGNE